MTALRTSLMRKRRGRTDEDLPWNIDVEDESIASLSSQHRAGWRLFHYLSGGGLRSFASSAMREVVSRRQTRFLWFSAVCMVFWLIFRYV